ncbi:uncharacterized protein LOC129590539 [Paramacrobiotus metropolitanus]|uniref:uncharacterized protein LOC129590539 n=1 Tax=Paramacrobiotus metropolitanus TaxID=2943436 RepID=UPI0024465B24|nr:uncharacterized protein LOC129590539 [Paramacrobiotus metropolitanus]
MRIIFPRVGSSVTYLIFSKFFKRRSTLDIFHRKPSLVIMSICSQPIPRQQRRLTVSLHYTIPTERFTKGHYQWAAPDSDVYRAWYVANVRVDHQQDYPQIPEAVWTVQLTVEQRGQQVTARVLPQDAHKDVKATSELTVQCTVRANSGASSTVAIGQDGWTEAYPDQPSSDLSTLVAPILHKPTGHVTGYTLRGGQLVYVTLAFDIATPRADLEALLISGRFTDCILVSSDHKAFPVHRAILAALSPVFAATFQHELTEKLTGVCRLGDIDGDLLETLLRYTYGRGRLSAQDRVEDLWMVADRYDMGYLRAECEDIMAADVDADNASYYATLARELGLSDLRQRAEEMVQDRRVPWRGPYMDGGCYRSLPSV